MVTPPSSQESGHVAAGSGRLMGTAHGASSERHECEDEIRLSRSRAPGQETHMGKAKKEALSRACEWHSLRLSVRKGGSKIIKQDMVASASYIGVKDPSSTAVKSLPGAGGFC